MPVGGYQITGGSIPGRDHIGRNEILLGRNNQDAFRWHVSEDAIMALVCDGCGSAPHSEVGAKVGAELLIRALDSRLREYRGKEDSLISRSVLEMLLNDVRLDVLGRLTDLARQLAGGSNSLVQPVTDYLLFTVVGLFITEHCGCIFSIGDGVWALNGELHRLGPFPGNAPPYLSYGLIPEKCLSMQHDVHFKLFGPFATGLIESLLIGTDGAADLVDAENRCIPGSEEQVGPLSQFWEDDQFFRNPDAVRRRLSVINREVKRFEADGTVCRMPGLLRDDTTLIALRREKEESNNA
jgi:hypothetical protein